MASLHAARRLIVRGLPARLRTPALAALVAWAFLPACAGENASQPDIRTEEGLSRALDEIEVAYEKACRDLGSARWDFLVKPSPETARGLMAARGRLGVTYGSDRLAEVLDYWAPRTTVTADPTLSRRVRIWDKSRRFVSIEADPQVSAMAFGLLSRMQSHDFRLDGKPTGKADLDRIIASEADPAKRRAAWTSRLSLASSVARDMRQLVRARAVRAQSTPSLYFHHVVMGASDLRPEWLYPILELLSQRTNPAYKKLLSALQEAAGVPALAGWDIDFAMNRLSARRGAEAIDRKYFPADGIVPAVRGLLEALGFDADKLPLKLVTSETFHGAAGLALSIPDDYRILIGPGAGGADLYEETFREVGRGLLAVLNVRQAPMLKGYDCAAGTRNGPYTEAMAEALAGFLYDPLFLGKQMKMTPEQIRVFLEDRHDRRLLAFRRQLLDSGMDYVLYVNPDANLDYRYATLHSNGLRVPVDPSLASPWPGEIDLVIDPVNAESKVVGGAIGRQLHRKLAADLGDARLGSGRAAAWFTERCFAPGEDLSLEERIARAIDSGYEFEKFTDWLVRSSPD